MQLNEVHRVFFVGAGGIGMSALVRYFLYENKPVAGYDKTPTPLTLQLIGEGADLHFEDSVSLIPEIFSQIEGTLVIYTPAIPQQHTQLNYFRSKGFQIKKRAEVLGMISDATLCLAVAGTHGKTTTSSILAHLLKESKNPVMAFLGGISEDFGSNFLLEGTDLSVVEADEFDRSFLWLHPQVACVTSMDADHLDIYGNHEALEESFVAFTEGLKPGGSLVVRNGLPLDGITYGIADGSDYCIENLRIVSGVYRFDINTPNQVFKDVQFGKPGRHNLLNALAAFTMALQVTDRYELLLQGLASFKGVERRFSYQIRTESLLFIDDYAHHPTEIDAVASAIREMHPGKEILAVFQPHLYSRTRDFGSDFAKSLSAFDSVWLLDIYPAREQPIPGITSQWLLESISNPQKRCIDKADLIAEIVRFKPQILLTIGAGDIGLLVEPIKHALSHETELEHS
jgi:UDP-N-acetylmuramate--alanine ligase